MTNSMRVHHIINDYSFSNGGAQRLVRNLHQGLLDRGIESKLFGLSCPTKEYVIHAKALNLKSPYRIQAMLYLYRYLRRNIKEGDIVHVHLFPANWFLSILKKLLAAKCILITTEHSTSNNRRDKLWGKYLDRSIYRSFRQVIAISTGTKNALLDWIPDIRDKVIQINNGANLSFDQFKRRQRKDKITILSVGTLRKAKNYSTSIEVISKLKKERIEYFIAGEGRLRKSLEKQVRELGIENLVTFLGHVEDVPNLLLKADIFLMPSIWEGFGLAAIEAMNAGLPCLVSNISGLGDLIERNGVDGLLVNPTDVDMITKKLMILIENYELRQKIGNEAFVRSKAFGINHMIDEYYKFYQKLIDE